MKRCTSLEEYYIIQIVNKWYKKYNNKKLNARRGNHW